MLPGAPGARCGSVTSSSNSPSATAAARKVSLRHSTRISSAVLPMSAASDREADAAQQVGDGEEVETDHVAVGPVDGADERGGMPLNRIATGFAVPFAAGDVAPDIEVGEPPEHDGGHDQPHRKTPVGSDQTDAAVNAMAAPGQKRQAGPGLRL